MKTTLLPLLALLSLAGCHAARDKDATPVAQAAATTPSVAGDEKAEQKARDQMMDKSMSVQDQHWASTETTPAGSSSSTGAAAGMGAQAQPATAPASDAGH